MAMIDEMQVLESNQTLALVPPPPWKSIVGCHQVFAIQVGHNGQIDQLKAQLVTKGFTQIFGLDYNDTFSSVTKMGFVHLLQSMAAMRRWPLYQLGIKKAFLHGDLAKEVYMGQHPELVAQRESSGFVCKL